MKMSVLNKKIASAAVIIAAAAMFLTGCGDKAEEFKALSDSTDRVQEFSFSAKQAEKQWLSVRLQQGNRVLLDWNHLDLERLEAVEAVAEVETTTEDAEINKMVEQYAENDPSIETGHSDKGSSYVIFATEAEYIAEKAAGFTGFAYLKDSGEFRLVYDRFKDLNKDEIKDLLLREAKMKDSSYSISTQNMATISLSFFQLWNSTGINGFIQGKSLKNLVAKDYIDKYNADHEAHSLAEAEEASFGGWSNLLMIGVGFLLLLLAIKFGFEPLLLVPIGIGAILANIPFANVAAPDGFIGMLYGFGVKTGLFPLLIFMGVGAMTDFGPLIANPKTFILGAAAQFGIFGALIIAVILGDVWGIFDLYDAASIGIIGGADGPTAIFVSSQLSPDLLGAIAVAAYSYMALVPIIQPPIMKALTTKKQRQIKMEQLREVSKTEKIIFPLVVIFVTALLLPSAIPLLGALMFGNLAKESGVVDRLSDTMQNSLINIVTIFLGLSVGSKMQAEKFVQVQTLAILGLGLFAFSVGTSVGVLFAQLMNKFSKKHPINPLIGAAGVSAVPMAARVVNKVGQQENPHNFLLMHAMGPNVAGVIGSAVAAGVLLNLVPFLA
jgi:oxaloacetate decarboxylase beta subunit